MVEAVLCSDEGKAITDNPLSQPVSPASIPFATGWLLGLAKQGTDPVVIPRMLRHSSKDMTMHYVHAKAREAQEQSIAELGIAADANSDDSVSSLRVQ